MLRLLVKVAAVLIVYIARSVASKSKPKEATPSIGARFLRRIK